VTDGPPGQHELVLVDSTDDLATAVVPRVVEALAALEPVYLELQDDAAQAVLDDVGESPLVHVLPRAAEPGAARATHRLDRARQVAARHRGEGRRIRMLSQGPSTAPAPWPDWLRLEASIGLLVPEVWQVCLFERNMLSNEQLAELCATHALLDTDGTAGPTRTSRSPSPTSAGPSGGPWRHRSSARRLCDWATRRRARCVPPCSR